MKRIIISLFLILMTKSLFAGVNVGGTAGAIYLNDLHLQSSFGWIVGVDLFSNVSVIYNGFTGSFSKSDLDSNGAVDTEREYRHFIHMGKVQYLYPLMNYRLLIGASAGFGSAAISYNRKDLSIETDAEEKLSIAGIWAEGKYHIDQKFSVIASAGFVSVDDAGKFAGKNISGPDFKVGVSYTLIGRNKKLY
ncbi:MAG: hypothetical protein JW982_04930 [Spirochaetes bacterium]|nr:hypothetical protein [Spirochaetota bacterium]